MNGYQSYLSIMVPALLTFTLIACHSAPELTPAQLAGKKLYNSRCAHCHEENDLALKPAPPSLHHIGEQGMLPNGGPATDESITRIVNFGKNKMPNFAGRFTDEQMAQLIAYIRTGLI